MIGSYQFFVDTRIGLNFSSVFVGENFVKFVISMRFSDNFHPDSFLFCWSSAISHW